MRDRRAASSTISDDGRLTVCYDAACAICSASAELLDRLDRVGRLRLVPLDSTDIPTVAAFRDRTELRRSLHVVGADGTVATGAEAVLHICEALPSLRPLASAGRLRLLYPFVERLYSIVAANRRRSWARLVRSPRRARRDRS